MSLALISWGPIPQAILSQFSRTRTSKKKSKTARTEFDAVLADLDIPEDELTEFQAELDLVPETEDDGDQTDEARDEADDIVLDDIENSETNTVPVSKEELLSGKQALEKVYLRCYLQTYAHC